MDSHQEFEEIKVPVKLKLAGLWASFMFLCIYVDYFHCYMPGKLEDLLEGRLMGMEIGPAFLTAALVSLSIPALMIFLSVALEAKINRRLNLIIASVYIPYTLSNLIGDAWLHMFYGAAVEVGLLVLILHYASKWPRIEKTVG